MMFMRRSPFGLLLMVGVGILLGAALFGTTAEVGSVVAAPLLVLAFLFKIALFVFLFGFVARTFGAAAHHKGRKRSGSPMDWWSDEARQRWDRRQSAGEEKEEDKASENDKFEEWHRMAHARQEVDDHVPPVED